MKIKQGTWFIVIVMMFTAILAQAQNSGDWLENTMYSSGKINVVIAVIAVVFVLLVIYLISIDRKLKKLEDRDKTKLT